MPQNVCLKFGTDKWCCDLPDRADVLTTDEPDFIIDQKQFRADFFSNLPRSLSTDSNICIVVADKTRLCGYETYLPWVIEALREKGINKQNITFYIAYGTHSRQSDNESLDAYGTLYKTQNFIHHNCNDISLFSQIGTTARGTKVRLRKDILKSDLIITFGALSHHYFAGYGGGRKLLFPGLAYKEDIYKNHSLFLDAKTEQLSPGCKPGNLEGNPLADDLKEIYHFISTPLLNIHGILNAKGKACQLIVGKHYHDFLRACTHLDSFYKAKTSKQYKLVVASCGGFPKDINFIQAHKAINNSAMFVKDGGSLVVFSQCRDGVGSDTFLPYFELSDYQEAFTVLKNDYKGNGGTALSMMTKTRRINIFLKTDLDDNICTTIGVTRIDDETIKKLMEQHRNNLACIENASLLIK